MYNRVVKNKFDFYELKIKPTPTELEQYYSEKYYQNSRGNYEHEYSKEEIRFFLTRIEQKYQIISKLLKESKDKPFRLLDVGCGEGWALSYFKKRGWKVTGVDFSTSGCQQHNPDCMDDFIPGDIYDSLDALLKQELIFSCIWLDNVLEHVLNPQELLAKCVDLLAPNGVLLIEVPNDFSIIQRKLYEQGMISDPFWIAEPDHISYFNRQGLINLCKSVELDTEYVMGDYPIDFNLFNTNTNYIKDPSKGKSCHKARVAIENLLSEISVEKTAELYEKLAELGIGRSLIGFFKKNLSN